MNKEAFNFQEDEELIDAIQRYEEMARIGEIGYFDVFEFEHIIDNYILQNHYLRALEVTQDALDQHPSSLTILFKKAHIYLNLGEISKCLSITDILINIEETNHELYLLIGSCNLISGETKKAEKNFLLALKFSIENKDETLYNIGFVYEKCDNIKKAISFFSESLKYNPDNEIVFYELAFCYHKINDYYQSIRYYNRYLDIDPFSDTAWFNLGIVYNNINDHKKAIKAYQFALAINDVFPSAIYNIANSCMSLKRYDKAIEYLESYIELDESSDDAYIMLGECYAQKNDFTNANKNYKKALSINSNNDKAWYLLGVALKRDKKYYKSLEAFKSALKIDPKNTDYLYSHAQICANLNYINDAIDSFETLCDLMPFYSKYWLKYSKFLNDKGLKSVAIEKLVDSLFFISDNSLILYRLAAYYLESMEEDKAIRYLEEALAIDYEKHKFFFRTFPEARLNQNVKEFINNYRNKRKSGVKTFC